MSVVAPIRARAVLWIGQAAAAMIAWREALRPPRQARLREQRDGAFILEPGDPAAAGKREAPPFRFLLSNGALALTDAARLAPRLARARVEIVLQPDRFLFRPMTLPRRAGEFLEAIVRSQIDRLTPWSAADAAFGFRPEPEAAGDRLQVTVAATARTLLMPFIDAGKALGVESVSIATPAPEGGLITVLERKIEGAVEAKRLRRILALLLAAVAALAAASLLAATIGGGELDSRRDAAERQIAQRRAALRQGVDANSAAAQALRQKKRDTPSSVLVFEELSRVLPDDAYLTELHIQGDKAQIVGLARDAPPLIRLIEQSPMFRAATFFAPTTRSAAEANERFFIEAQIRPAIPAAGAAPP